MIQFKKFLALILVMCMALANINTTSAKASNTTNFEETFVDTNGEKIKIVYSITGNSNIVDVYVNNILTQHVTADGSKDFIQIEYINQLNVLSRNVTRNGNKIEKYKISDFVTDISENTLSNKSKVSAQATHTHSWSLHKTYAPSPILSGSKTCYLYSGSFVWKNSYITKRWVVIHDDINDKYSYELDNSAYSSNRGQTPDDIAFNAQVATM